ncbi:hypothetical protein [Phaeodactylibacter xiamenensis]|uniref:hypothetical protein n=1 Tax=Phaeodactylibacter xiamenensis TaxID=1524460 RepID=UPI003BA88AB8
MKNIRIKGTIKHVKLEGGFWGIVADDGREYRPVQMPEQLKHDGESVEVTLKPEEEEMSIHMWGQPVKVVSFHTLHP